MQIKEGASLQGLDVVMRPALIAADKIWKAYGQELVVTCGTDGTHSAGSYHYYGRALDFRTRDFNNEAKEAVFHELSEAIAWAGMDVVLEKTHMHVEFDPKPTN